ncbi:hypothetical protein DSM19430T_03970 [Desulfovibrio psychrotolerans]|uniref:Uncharacterized protein n=1 Tax=Desulfovibrio psychrotolerans TaxID=415242 RepID=A0A7J0BPT5_9BACT|nr:hypothetical protein DSM19430T_03970 [Desulfovibrio psychrotolerans]
MALPPGEEAPVALNAPGERLMYAWRTPGERPMCLKGHLENKARQAAEDALW